MRKHRDFDSELRKLDDRVRQLKVRKLQQLGELVIASGAGSLPIDVLAGALLDAAKAQNTAAKEEWRVRGAAFFRQSRRKQAATGEDSSSAESDSRGTLPLVGGSGAH